MPLQNTNQIWQNNLIAKWVIIASVIILMSFGVSKAFACMPSESDSLIISDYVSTNKDFKFVESEPLYYFNEIGSNLVWTL